MQNSKLQLKSQKLKITRPFTLNPIPYVSPKPLEKGQSLVELLIALALCAILLPALLTGLVTSRQGKAQQEQRLQAMALVKEAHEALRVVREKNWAEIATNGTYHIASSSGTWTLVASSEAINGYTRSIVISDAVRAADGVIATIGGTVDSSTKKIVTTVSWGTPIPASVSETEYLSRYLNNKILTQTTQSDFNMGTKSGTTVTNTNGGEVTMAAGGNADWCTPQPVVSAADLPRQGVANAITAIEGRIFAGTGDNASGVSFANVTIPNTASPSGTISGTFDGYKTNGVFGETNYAYLATDTGAEEIVILDLTHKDINNKYSEIGFFNPSDNNKANSIYVVGTIGYMTVGNILYTFDLSSKSGSRPVLGSIALAATGNKIMVVGNYAYIALDSATTQLQIVQVSPDGKTLSIVGQTSVAGLGARDVFVNNSATRAYLATQTSATQKEMFILDVTTKTGNRPTLGSYDTTGMDPKGITVVTSNKAIVVGSGGEEYQVVSIVDEANPTRCGGMNVDTGVNGVASVIESDGDAYSYIITGDASSELKIIRGGPGGGIFQPSGYFESSTIDATVSAAFNRFVATVQSPSLTTIKFQVAGIDANPATGNCTGVAFTYVGPGATTSAYFATSSAEIPMSITGAYKNPARCFRYKAFFTSTDTTQSPVLYDMTLNYSP